MRGLRLRLYVIPLVGAGAAMLMTDGAAQGFASVAWALSVGVGTWIEHGEINRAARIKERQRLEDAPVCRAKPREKVRPPVARCCCCKNCEGG